MPVRTEHVRPPQEIRAKIEQLRVEYCNDGREYTLWFIAALEWALTSFADSAPAAPSDKEIVEAMVQAHDATHESSFYAAMHNVLAVAKTMLAQRTEKPNG